MHEASRKILSVLLQRIEGFKGKGKSLLICATNRQFDLDSALLSRFDVIIKFELPDFSTRIKIFQRYAYQFHQDTTTLNKLAEISEGFSCRDIKEICEHAERKLASKLINRGKIKNNQETEDNSVVPSLEDYMSSISYRKSSMNKNGNYGRDTEV